MTTHTTAGFTPVEPDLYARAFALLDPAPPPPARTPIPAPAGSTPAPTVPTPTAPKAMPIPASLPTPVHLRTAGPVEQVLVGGLKFLDTHGWVQRRLIDPGGARCSIGALRAAAGARTPAYRDAGNLLLDEARRQHGNQWQTLPTWNDSHSRSQVRSVWRAAIQRAQRMNL